MATSTPFQTEFSVVALNSVVSKIEVAERERRASDALEVSLFAEAIDQVLPERFLALSGGKLVAGNAQAEIAYRAMRAELALALTASEHTIERRLSHAYELTQYYHETFLRLSEGSISRAHTEVIVQAGHVIGEGITIDVAARRSAYEAAVLVHAARETPARLRPIAKRLAEQYAELTIDERFAEAHQARRVWVVDQEDGMSDLVAHIPTVEAHAIYDRLTQAGKALALVEAHRFTKAGGEASSGGGGEAASGGGPEASSGGEVGGGASDSSDAGGGGGAGGEGGAGGGASLESAAKVQRRNRDQLRADLFSDLLREANFDYDDLVSCADESSHTKASGAELPEGTASTAGEANAAGEANTAGDTGTAGDTCTTSTTHKHIGSSPISGVRAHVQIFVTDKTLFSNTLQINEHVGLVGAYAEHKCAQGGSAGSAGTATLDWGAPSSLPPAELAGSCPIDTSTAKQIAADADSWDLVHQHPNTGAIISVDRYRPSEQMRRMLRARDLHCRFPGCRAPAHRCDLDHTVDAAKGGPTSTRNLASLCRGHHTLKHHGGWKVTQAEAGVLEWRSPTSRTYIDQPPSRVRFVAPPKPIEPPEPPEPPEQPEQPEQPGPPNSMPF